MTSNTIWWRISFLNITKEREKVFPIYGLERTTRQINYDSTTQLDKKNSTEQLNTDQLWYVHNVFTIHYYCSIKKYK